MDIDLRHLEAAMWKYPFCHTNAYDQSTAKQKDEYILELGKAENTRGAVTYNVDKGNFSLSYLVICNMIT